MSRRTAAAVAVLVLALVLAPIAAGQVAAQQSGSVIGEPQLTASTSSGALTPGTTTDVSLSITNRGQIRRGGPEEHESQVTTARGTILRVDSGDTPIEVNTGAIAVGNVPTGTVDAGALSLTVPEGTEPGTYELPVEYEYEYTSLVRYGDGSPEYRDRTATETGTLEVTVDDRPTFAVVNRTSNALVGETGQLAVTLRNTGTQPARDARVNITSGSSSMTFGSGAVSSTSYAGVWAEGETKTVTYEATVAEDADPGTYATVLSVRYRDEQGIEESSPTLTMGVPVGDEQEFAFRDVATSLRAGYEGELSGTLVNEGPNAVRNPVAVLQANDDSLTITSSEEAVSDLAPGESASVNFTVDVSSDASAARQQFELAVDYDTALGDRRTSSPLRPSVQIRPSQDRFAVSPANDTIAAGSTRSFDLEVTNRGDERLRNVDAKAYVESPLSSGDDEGIIDSLAPGETKTVTIELGAASTALEKSYSFELDFQYEQPDGDTETSDTYTVPVSVTVDEGGGGLPLLPIGVVLVLVAIGVYWYRRRS